MRQVVDRMDESASLSIDAAEASVVRIPRLVVDGIELYPLRQSDARVLGEPMTCVDR